MSPALLFSSYLEPPAQGLQRYQPVDQPRVGGLPGAAEPALSGSIKLGLQGTQVQE